MYVQYQIPVGKAKPPVVLVHGGGGTGAVWESTPDGREGYQSLLVRQGYPVYIVDFPRRGRSGFPAFTGGVLGNLDGAQYMPDNASKSTWQFGWTRWRLGPAFPQRFPVDQFGYGEITPESPLGTGVDQFFKALVPGVQDNATVITDALVALFDKIGPGILITHSQSGLFGWMTAMRSDNVRAVVSYEPGFVFTQAGLPPPVPLSTGSMVAGNVVTDAEFARLAQIPIQVVYGDNIPTSPVSDIPADGRRAQVIVSVPFCQQINALNGDCTIQHLRDAGLVGNTHFAYSDLNNQDVLAQLLKYFDSRDLNDVVRPGKKGNKKTASN
jgi:pimeloyl-ACP methyl ester carboxylesterase